MNCGNPIPKYRTQQAQKSAEDAKGVQYFLDLVSVFFRAYCVLLRLLRALILAGVLLVLLFKFLRLVAQRLREFFEGRRMPS